MEPLESAFDGAYRAFTFYPNEKCFTVEQLFLACNEGIKLLLLHLIHYGFNVKVFVTARIHFAKINISDGSVEKEDYSYFSNTATPIQTEQCVEMFLNDTKNALSEHVDKFTRKGSNWIVQSIDFLCVRVVRYRLMKGGANNFKLPPELTRKQCVINVDVDFQQCLKYAIIVALHYDDIDNTQRNAHIRGLYDQFLDRYNFEGLQFPSTVADIILFQKQNKEVAINALLYHVATDTKQASVEPLYHPPHSIILGRRLANILLIHQHWLPIVNLNRLLGQGKANAVYCFRCLRNLYHRDRLEKHLQKCYNTVGQKETMPAADKAFKKFNDWSKMLSPPAIIYADVEVLLQRTAAAAAEGVKKQRPIQTHMPIAVGAYAVPHKDLPGVSPHIKLYQGLDCMERFCQDLNDLVIAAYVYNRYNCQQPQQRLPAEVQIFNEATCCEYCHKSFLLVPKVWHHCHISGRFLAAVCQECNTKVHQPIRTLPIVFHNLKNYDMHALCIAGLAKIGHWRLSPIAQTTERYITLTAYNQVDIDENGSPIYFTLRFIDSYQFLSASLDRLASSLDRQAMQHVQGLRHVYYELDEDVLYHKGVFPYSYLDCEEKMDERQLPAIEEFFDTLSNSQRTTPADYARAQKAWRQFNCRTLGDYLMRYLQVDCLLLADVFENYRVNSIREYALDPANFITLPQYTFAAAFKQSQCDLLTDVEMYEHFEDGIRGGMCFVNKHLLQAQNLAITPTLSTHPSTHTYISYWDANNLYGNALRQLLPCAEFVWLTRQEAQSIDWAAIDTEGQYGYCLRVDLHYPPAVQDATQDYPLAAEQADVEFEMFTPFMKQQWAKRCEMRESAAACGYKKERKLLMSVSDKKDYVVHFKLLKFYLKMGLQLMQVHSVIKFKQAAIFRDYIDHNSALRQAATDDFSKDMYKLLNNSLFGKTMENVRGRKDYKLVNNEASLLKETSKPQFISLHRFAEDLVLVHLFNLNVKLDKPIFIGQAVLDLSKLIMYELRYETLPKYEAEFGGKIEVCGGDTDSLVCFITGINLSEQLHPAMLRDDLLDSSNYVNTHVLWSSKNKARLGCIKDEVCGEVLREAVLLKPKCYSMITLNNKHNKKTAKGVQRCVREAITHERYLEVLLIQKEVMCNMCRFDSQDHIVFTIE